MAAKLSQLQQRFISHYLVGHDPAKAAVEAGYKIRPPKTARQIGYEILKKDKVINEISDRKMAELMSVEEEPVEEEPQIASPERIVAEMSRIATLKDSELNCVDGDYKSTDKLKALEMMGRHYSLFKETHQHNVDLSFNQILKDIDGSSTRLPDASELPDC